MADRIMIFSWDQAPSSKLEKLVNLAAHKLGNPGCPSARVWVWLERRRDEKDHPFDYVRLEAQLFSMGRPDGWRVRVESSGTSAEQACRRAFRALDATSAAPPSAAAPGNVAVTRAARAVAPARAPAVRRPPLTGLRSVALGSTGASVATARS
jgi:hypothetical protein